MNVDKPLDFKSEYVRQQLACAPVTPIQERLYASDWVSAITQAVETMANMHVDVVEICDAVITAAQQFSRQDIAQLPCPQRRRHGCGASSSPSRILRLGFHRLLLG